MRTDFPFDRREIRVCGNSVFIEDRENSGRFIFLRYLTSEDTRVPQERIPNEKAQQEASGL